MKVFYISVLLSAVGASARQNSNFNVTPEYADSHGCGSKCQQILDLTNKEDLDSVGHDFSFDFFATAANFSTATQPGDVLKVEALNVSNRDVDSGTTVYRIQYASKDLDGETVPATGFIAFPYTPHFVGGSGSGSGSAGNETKYKLAAYSHGTIGLFEGCAPSNSPNLYDYKTWKAAVQRGYAVVATDYAGLGNNFTSHKYLTLPAQVHDVYYSVVAARKLFGAVLTEEWVSFGHSQGGGTVWKLAESEYVRNDARYLGTVALAPATYIIDMLMGKYGEVDFSGYLSFLPIAAERALPGYNATFLSDVMRKRIELATKAQLCISGMLALPADLNKTQLVSPGGLAKDKDRLHEWQRMLSPAQGDRSPAPVMVVQGLSDTSVLPNTTVQAWEAACGFGNEVHLRLYPGQEHSPLMEAGAPEWLGWMDELISGAGKVRQSKKCTSFTRRPFSNTFVKQPAEGGKDFLKAMKRILQG